MLVPAPLYKVFFRSFRRFSNTDGANFLVYKSKQFITILTICPLLIGRSLPLVPRCPVLTVTGANYMFEGERRNNDGEYEVNLLYHK